MREFNTGATRDDDDLKLDYEGFLSPDVLQAFAVYMHKHRVQADGKLRDSDNWQKGIPKTAYMKSMFRHFMDVWQHHRGSRRIIPLLLRSRKAAKDAQLDSLMALLFNVQGYARELINEGAEVLPE